MAKAFTFYSDPAHGWLCVAPDDLAALGLSSRDFTRYSYIGRDGKVYLEEDCDATKFIAAYEEKHREMFPIVEKHTNGNSHVRSMASVVPF